MGFLEDLIVIVKESVDEAKTRQAQPQQRPVAPVPARVPAPQAVRERQGRAQPLTQRVVVEPAAPRRPAPAAAPKPVAPPQAARGAERIARLLRQPRTVRELVVLKEILDKPLALRHGRR
jgi:translation initiation factor IF-3